MEGLDPCTRPGEPGVGGENDQLGAEPREGDSLLLMAFGALPCPALGVCSFPVSGWFEGGLCPCKPPPLTKCPLAPLSHQPLPECPGVRKQFLPDTCTSPEKP